MFARLRSASPKAYRPGAALLALSYLCTAVAPAAAAPTVTLPDGRTASVSAHGIATVYDPRTRRVFRQDVRSQYAGIHGTKLPDKEQLVRTLMTPTGNGAGYATGKVVVVYRDGIVGTSDSVQVSEAQLSRTRLALDSKTALSPADVPSYTNDTATNMVLSTLGVKRQDRLFSNVNRSLLTASYRSIASVGTTSLNPANAYTLAVAVNVRDAVLALQNAPGVKYVSAAWLVGPMHTQARPLEAQDRQRALAAMWRLPQAFGRSMRSPLESLGTMSVPTNYAVASSQQSLLNTPSLDVISAYDLITKKYNQLPGTGETITNVSIGDLTDASENTAGDPCEYPIQATGPTTIVSGAQRYIDWPSMPLIPTYTADANGNINGLGEVCGLDPYMGEVGLDFSMMAPLPHNAQRSGNRGSGLTDLFGIAPGANYRLIVPASFNPTYADIDAALMAAGQQSPRPNVITASIGFGEDGYGFPGRFLEDDPLSESVIASLVQSGIVVVISANDGTREFTDVAISPSGGSAPTNVLPSGQTATTLNDIAFSTTPSLDPDSGSIAAGGTTLDDIFAAQPQNSNNASLVSQHAFAETRWTGFRQFSSGFGTRVNLSAPSDNVISFEHTFGGNAQAVSPVVEGGTSASAPEVAAAAAVVLQVARLTGHPLTSPAAVRSFLAATGTAVPAVPQSDVVNAIGPQVDLGRAVSTLFHNANISIQPGIVRVAVEQRRAMDYGTTTPFPFAVTLDGMFTSDTDPTNIDLAGPVVSTSDSTLTAADSLAWITIAPDWEGLPSGTTFKLTATATGNVVATTPWARMIPEDIITDDGQPLLSSSTRTVTYKYAAYSGRKVIASTTIPLTFGPLTANPLFMLAPVVPAVETGSSIPVAYDLTHVANLSNPRLVVSRPGRVDPVTGSIFDPAYTVSLSGSKGTVNVPVSKLNGSGIYGIGVQFGTYQTYPLYSDFAFVRVAPTSTSRPPAPLLSANGSTPGHTLEIPYGTSFKVSWDVRKVPNATGAMLEISAPGPGIGSEYEPFNNPNGNVRDANGVDTGSSYFASVGTNGTITLNPATVGLTPTFNHVVRVLPVSGSTAVGEAGDVSSIMEDGVLPNDGNPISGFGINENSTDGFVTTDLFDVNGDSTAGTYETFSQVSKQMVQAVTSSTHGYDAPFDIFGNDLALYAPHSSPPTFDTLDPASTFTSGPQFTFPFPWDDIGPAAENQTSDNALFIANDDNNNQYIVSSNLLKNTSTTTNITAFDAANYPGGIAQDPANNIAYVGFDPSNGNCSTGPGLLTVNLKSTTFSSVTIPGIGLGGVAGLAVDLPLTAAAVLPSCANNVGLYNYKTNTETVVPIPPLAITQADGSALYDLVVDPVNHLALVIDTAPADITTNNNAMYSVIEIDERTGTVVKTIEQFGASNALAFAGGTEGSQPSLLINPTRREGWFFSYATQLQPFSY